MYICNMIFYDTALQPTPPLNGTLPYSPTWFPARFSQWLWLGGLRMTHALSLLYLIAHTTELYVDNMNPIATILTIPFGG